MLADRLNTQTRKSLALESEVAALRQHCELRSEPLLRDPKCVALLVEDRQLTQSLGVHLAASSVAAHVLARQIESNVRHVGSLAAQEEALGEARKKKAQACQKAAKAALAQAVRFRVSVKSQPVGAIADPEVKARLLSEEAAEEAAAKEAPPPGASKPDGETGQGGTTHKESSEEEPSTYIEETGRGGATNTGTSEEDELEAEADEAGTGGDGAQGHKRGG